MVYLKIIDIRNLGIKFIEWIPFNKNKWNRDKLFSSSGTTKIMTNGAVDGR